MVQLGNHCTTETSCGDIFDLPLNTMMADVWYILTASIAARR
jgi:hypothetical protein